MKVKNIKNFIYSSSATVYGVPEKLPLTEEMETGKCTNPYGKTKFFVEEVLKDLCQSDKSWSDSGRSKSLKLSTLEVEKEASKNRAGAVVYAMTQPFVQNILM